MSGLANIPLEREYLALLVQCPPERGDELLAVADYAAAQHRQVAAAIEATCASGELQTGFAFAIENEVRRAGGPVVLVRELSESDAVTRFDGHGMRARLRELARLRRARDGLLRAVASTDAENIEEAVEHAQAALDGALTLERVRAEQAATVALIGLHEIKKNAEGRTRMLTGYDVLDSAFHGLRAGTMWVIGGRTGAGKSSVLLGAAINLASNGTPVGLVSCEDTRSVWGPRILGHLCGVSEESFRGQVSFDTNAEVERGLAKARELGLHFVFALNRPLADVVSGVRELARLGCKVIAVDYLQSIMLGGSRDRHDRAVSHAAQTLKAECQALGCVLVLCSQLKRASDDNPFREPHNGHLKESGDIENMAELIALLWQTSDAEDAPVFGKVSKVKWSKYRPRFRVDRSEAGVVSALKNIEPATAASAPRDDASWQRNKGARA